MVQLKDVLPSRKRGSAHWGSKLTEADIPRIRELRSQGGSIMGLARAYGVTPPTIYNVLRGVTWRHVLTTPTSV